MGRQCAIFSLGFAYTAFVLFMTNDLVISAVVALVFFFDLRKEGKQC